VFPERSKLSGAIEVDEFYLGGEHSGLRGRGAEHKSKVVVAIVHKGRKLGRLRSQVIQHCSTDELVHFAKENIATGSQITTDDRFAYRGLPSEGYPHKIIIQGKTEDKESVLPGVHLVTSLFKRLILGTFQGSFDPQYLQRYLDEYVFCFNRRTCWPVGKKFWRLVQQATHSEPIFRNNLMLAPIVT